MTNNPVPAARNFPPPSGLAPEMVIWRLDWSGALSKTPEAAVILQSNARIARCRRAALPGVRVKFHSAVWDRDEMMEILGRIYNGTALNDGTA